MQKIFLLRICYVIVTLQEIIHKTFFLKYVIFYVDYSTGLKALFRETTPKFSHRWFGDATMRMRFQPPSPNPENSLVA